MKRLGFCVRAWIHLQSEGGQLQNGARKICKACQAHIIFEMLVGRLGVGG